LELIEIVYQLSGLTLLVCGIYFYLHFKKMKKTRRLTGTERFFYVTTRIALTLFAVSMFLKVLDKYWQSGTM